MACKERELSVSCRSEERRCEHETLTRTHTRSCELPKDVDVASLAASLNAGVLTISVLPHHLPIFPHPHPTPHLQGKKLQSVPVTERDIKVNIL